MVPLTSDGPDASPAVGVQITMTILDSSDDSEPEGEGAPPAVGVEDAEQARTARAWVVTPLPRLGKFDTSSLCLEVRSSGSGAGAS